MAGEKKTYLCTLDTTEAKCQHTYVNEDVPYVLCSAGKKDETTGEVSFAKKCPYRLRMKTKLPVGSIGTGTLTVEVVNGD